MKPLEMVAFYSDFITAIDSNAVPTDVKLGVALEVLHNLPPEELCRHAPATREWLGKAVQAVITTLQTEHDRTITEAAASATKAAQAATPTVRHGKTRKESVGE